MTWQTALQHASFRGIGFKVLNSRSLFGRRNARHDYPFRDTPWMEDMGRRGREMRIVGFLVAAPGGDGEDVIAARDALVAAVETQDAGELVHPTLGRLRVSMLEMEVEEGVLGRTFGLQMTFIEAGLRIFPSTTISTTAAGKTAVSVAFVSQRDRYRVRMQNVFLAGRAVVVQVQATAAAYVRRVGTVIGDATSVYNLAAGLPGVDLGIYGRFFGGRTRSGLKATPVRNQTPTLTTLLAAASVARTGLSSALVALTTAAGGTDADATSEATQALLQAVQAASEDPADGIRILLGLAVFAAPQYVTTAAIGSSINAGAQATADLFRRAAVSALAQAALDYQPASYDDAVAVRAAVMAALDVEIQTAADQGEDGVFGTLRALRTAVALDLATRGANLAVIGTFASNATLPAPCWAMRLYRDNDRTDQLVRQVAPVHPAFMPVRFKALAS